MSSGVGVSSRSLNGGGGSGGGSDRILAQSEASTSSSASSSVLEGEVYTRADGKKVRRVKRATSAGIPQGKAKTLEGFLSSSSGGGDKGQSKLSKLSGSRSVGAGGGDVYIRSDGKKVRRVRKSSASSVSSEDPSKKTLTGFLDSGDHPKQRMGGSASVAGDQIAVSKESSLTGEVYVRADGKKVRRVKKSALAASSSSQDEDMEIITRPDGTKVRRVRRTKPVENASSNDTPSQTTTAMTTATTSNASPTEKLDSGGGRGLSGFLEGSTNQNQPDRNKNRFSGSFSVAGDQHLEGEIYLRADGKTVRRVRKVKPASSGSATSETSAASSLSGFLDSDITEKSKTLGGSATVIGDVGGGRSSSDTERPETEIFVRPDGTKVRRIRRTSVKTADKATAAPEEKKTLGGFLLKNEPSTPTPRKIGGSASVAGDQIAISKESSLTGEVYVRADGKKVRRVKKSLTASSTSSVAAPGDHVEIITRPDGTKVRRIRKVKPKSLDDSAQLSGFLNSQPKTAPSGGGATVSGDRLSASEMKNNLTSSAPPGSIGAKESLDGFLGKMDSKPRMLGGSASVAGDQIAVSKDSSLTGEVYVRADGKKVRRVKKPSQVQPGDQVEIVTRPDGTKVRRIRRAKKPPEVATASQGSDSASLGGFLGSLGVEKKGSSATVAGDMAEGEIYVRADGIKVRRVRRTVSSSAANDDQYEIYVRPDGKKVRRIRRSALAAQQKAPDEREEQSRMELQQPSIGSLLSADEAVAARASSAAIVARDDVSGGKALLAAATVQPSPQTQAPSALSPDDEDTASRYRNMLRMGTPAEADAQKMIGDGVTQNIQDSVLSSASSSTTAGAGAAAVPTNTPSKSSSLSSEDEATALHYRRMLKMGMPEGAVMQKMSVEGVARHIQDSVLARDEPTTVSRPANGTVAVTASSAIKKESTGGKVSSLSPEEEEIASMYRRMMKMGMPEGAVTQKMTVDAVSQNIQDSVIAGEIPASLHVSAEPQQKAASLSPDEEEIATTYRKMLKMGMPEGAVMQKMGVDGVAQNVQESVLAPEVPATAESPATIIRKDGFSAPDGMVLVPKEQANRIIPDGMVAVPRGQVCDGVPDGFVLVPKDRYNGDQIILMSPGESLNRNKLYSDVDISGANVVSMDDLPEQVEKLKVGDGKGQPRFLLQALPEDRSMEDDFIRKNLLPKQEVSSAVPAPPPAPAAPSSSVAEILAQMSSMGGEFDAEKMGELLAKLEAAEKRQAKLEKQLAAAGIAIGEDIDYDICVKKVEEIGKRMNAIGGSDVTHPDKEEQNRLREEYFKLEQEMEKYNSALLLTDEYQAEQDRLEKKWEEDNAPGNLEALKKLRRHMPVEVRNMSEAQLTTEPTPNGKYLPKATAKKFKRTNVLQLIRRAPDDIVRMHPSTLENMRVTGLTLTERRALYEHVRDIGPQWKAMKAEKMTERKWTWYNMMKSNFKENLSSWQRHVDQYGPPGAHPYATRANPNEGCPLIGKQCPLKADKLMDYDGDYGFTDEAVYEVSEVRKADTDDPGAKAMQEALELMKEKKANERSDALKKHYSGKLLQVSKANGSCEQMDEMMDKIEYGMMKWLEDIINLGEEKSNLAEDVKKKEAANFMDVLNDCKLSILDICGRSGMQLSGKRTDEEKPDPRSVIECSLALEVAEAFNVFCRFVTDRLKQTEVSDTRINSTIDMLQKLLKELNERNQKTIKALGGERLERSRKLKTQVDIENEIKAKQKAVEPPPSPPEEAARAAPSLPGPPRGGLMDAIKSGRGGRGGGRGGLLDAIKGGGGRGRGGSGGGGGRGGLLAAIEGRGGGGSGRGGGGDGGRGGLLASIQARGSGGRGRGGGDGGRGGLLAAIAARGVGGD